MQLSLLPNPQGWPVKRGLWALGTVPKATCNERSVNMVHYPLDDFCHCHFPFVMLRTYITTKLTINLFLFFVSGAVHKRHPKFRWFFDPLPYLSHMEWPPRIENSKLNSLPPPPLPPISCPCGEKCCKNEKIWPSFEAVPVDVPLVYTPSPYCHTIF